MILTEKEASTKSCCRPVPPTFAHSPCGSDPLAETAYPMWPCIGSRCMAWAWNGPEPHLTIILMKPGLEDPGDHWALIDDPTAQDIGDERMEAIAENPGTRAFKSVPHARMGFCGLAKQ